MFDVFLAVLSLHIAGAASGEETGVGCRRRSLVSVVAWRSSIAQSSLYGISLALSRGMQYVGGFRVYRVMEHHYCELKVKINRNRTSNFEERKSEERNIRFSLKLNRLITS